MILLVGKLSSLCKRLTPNVLHIRGFLLHKSLIVNEKYFNFPKNNPLNAWIYGTHLVPLLCTKR
jgi:hypothetical protein